MLVQTTRQWALATLLGALSLTAAAHGDVTPHPVDTSTLKPVGSDWMDTNPYRGNKKAEKVGSQGYLHNCACCHDLNAVSGGMAPDVLAMDEECLGMDASQQAGCFEDADIYFRDIVLHGKTLNGRVTMPAYQSVFTQEAVWAIKAYIDARAVSVTAGK